MPKTKKTTEKIETIEVYWTETYSTFVSRGPVTITISDYPELEGMSEEEIKDYIRENAADMSPTSDWADNLSDELEQSDIIKEKVTDQDYEIVFE